MTIFRFVCSLSDLSSVSHRTVACGSPGAVASPTKRRSISAVAMMVLPAAVGAERLSAEYSPSCAKSRVARRKPRTTSSPNRAVAAGLARELGLDADELRPPDPDARARAFAGARRRQEAALVA